MTGGLSFHRGEYSALGLWRVRRISISREEAEGKGIEGPRCYNPSYCWAKASSLPRSAGGLYIHPLWPHSVRVPMAGTWLLSAFGCVAQTQEFLERGKAAT